jgi:NitT/TauT family transport system permease protein
MNLANKSNSTARRWHDRQRYWLSALSLLLFLVLWELAPALGWVKPLFSSSPSRILQAAIWLFANGFWYDIGVSLSEFGSGMGLAILVGIPLGIGLGWSPLIRSWLEPYVIFLDAVPRVALLPLLILWFGIGLASKVAIVFLGAVFPLAISVMAGVRTTSPNLIRCAQVFGANDRQLLRTIVLPGLVPFMISGLRIGVGRGLVGIVVGELVAARAGIGFMMSRAGAVFQTDKVFVGVLTLGLLGLLLTSLLKLLERRFDRWRSI